MEAGLPYPGQMRRPGLRRHLTFYVVASDALKVWAPERDKTAQNGESPIRVADWIKCSYPGL